MKKNFTKSRSPVLALELPSNHYYIDGLGAITDYLKLRGNHVVQLQGRPQAFAQLAQKIAIPKDLPIVSVTDDDWVRRDRGDKEGALPKSGLQALVKIETMGEAKFLEHLETDAVPSKWPLLLALDHLTDPRNLGAIVRTAAFLGIRFVVVPEDRQVLLTPAAVATAQAGFAAVDLVVVTNLVRALNKLKKKGYWIFGAAMDGQPLEAIEGFQKIVLVLGNEQTGLSRLVGETCDQLVSVPAAPSGIDSLNVAVAAGILTYGLIKGIKRA